MWRPVFYLSAVAINAYAIVHDQLYIILPLPSEKLVVLPLEARVMFLTFWNLVMQTIYFLIAFLNYMYGTDAQMPKRPPLIRKIKDTLFSIAFPVAIYVSLTFWIIYAVDKELIFPDYIERAYPTWMNHVMHTTVAIFILIEFLTSFRVYPSRKTGLAIMIGFNIIYVIWMFFIYFKWTVWVYPMFYHLDWISRVLFIIVSLFVGVGFYIVGEKLNQLVCDNPEHNYANGKLKVR